MNILMLHGSSDMYGASKILLVTVKTLLSKGCRVSVILSSGGPLAAELQEAGAEVIFIQLGILRRKYKSFKGIANRMTVMRAAYHAIKNIILEKNITVVYSNTTAVLAGAFAARRMKVKHVWHVHEIIEKPAWLRRFLGNLLNRYSDKVIVVSEAVLQSWQKYVPQKKISIIHNGIDYLPYLQPSHKLRNELGIGNDTVIIGMVGRVHHWKGQEYFLEMASLLLKKNPSLHFVMIGDAFPGYEYLYDGLTAIIQRNNMAAKVTDLGYRTDVAELLQGFDIFVLPSTLPDPFPTVVLEAMASAKPVIATRHGGAREMVDDGNTGILIPWRDAARAADMIEPLIGNGRLRLQMGNAGRKKVLDSYSLEAFENKMLKILE